MAKKYYWLKLKEGFFGDKEIKKLRKIAGGDTYTIIYLKLLLLSLKNEGRLFYDEIEETFAEELALEIDEDQENVKVTLIYLKQMGLLEEINQNEAFLTQIPETIGSETDKAALMRKKRQREKLLSNGNNVTEALSPVTFCYTDIEKEKELHIEKDKKEDIKKKEKSIRHKYGEYDNVLLSDSDYEKLKNEFPKDYQQRIENLSGYIESTGKVYKNHLATIRVWAKKETKQNQQSKASYDINELEKISEPPKTVADDPTVKARAEALKLELQGG